MNTIAGCLGGMWGMAPLGFLLVAGLVGIVLAIASVARAGGQVGVGSDSGGDSALATLRERFARGEIATEEFTQRRSMLEAAQAGTL